MAIKMYKITPDYTTKPGDTLRDSLESLSMTQAELAERMGITRKHASELLTGKSRITPQTANQLEFVLDVPAKYWLALQGQYDEFLEKTRQDEELANHVKYVKKFPYNAMAKNGFVPATKDRTEQLKNLLRFFRVSSFETFVDQTSQNPLLVGAFRSSAPKFDLDTFALHAWLQEGTILASKITTHQFNANLLNEKLPEFRALVQLTNPRDFMPKLQALAASVGIAVVAVPELPKSRVSGATRWLSPFPKAIIELSFRHKSHDSFWFTFFHELGHLVLHNKIPFFSVNRSYGQTIEEQQADAWATNILIPKKDWHAFITSHNTTNHPIDEAAIIAFSQKIQTHPDIILGRLQNAGILDYSQFSTMRIHYHWSSEKND